jgi:hypothetical protein
MGALIAAWFLAATVGCVTGAKIAVQVVGKVVDDAEAKKLGDELIRRDAAAADARLGPPLDVWRNTGDAREWRVYPVSLDLRGNDRYVVQMSDGKVVGVAKVAIDDSGMDIARNLLLDQKVTGKTPAECETALAMGPPLVTARSEKTGHMAQLYDAKLVQGVGSPKYCRLLFDASGRCNECKLVDVSASAGQAPPS